MAASSLFGVLRCFGTRIAQAAATWGVLTLENIHRQPSEIVTELRVRADKPIVLQMADGSRKFLTDECGNTLTVDHSQLRDACRKLCEYSVYRRQGEINNGFITVRGGHRVGVCGTAVTCGGSVRTVTDITSVNIRVARDFAGCSEEYFRRVGLSSCLIVGVPSSGKTTLLRDIARTLSTAYEKKVSVVDERGEIAADGFDLGLCDVYTAWSKPNAMVCAVRSMSPDYIVCDELTGDDEEGVLACLNYGVRIIATLHSDSLEGVRRSAAGFALLAAGAFESAVILDRMRPCVIKEIVKGEKMLS